LHAKRRKGWLRCAQAEHPLRYGQELQDLVLFENILHGQKNGVFWELGAGDGVVGLHSLALELFHGWRGVLVEHKPRALPWRMARERRTAQCCEAAPENFLTALKSLPEKLAKPDVLASQSAAWNEAAVAAVLTGALTPRVLILYLPEPDTRWVHRLRAKHRLAFAYHDDEYYVARA
jgi:hypothetical protein